MVTWRNGWFDFVSFQVEQVKCQIEGGLKPGQVIVHVAQESGASMIVVGTRGLGSVRRTLLGSVSDYVLHHAHCPVVVCREWRHADSNHGSGTPPKSTTAYHVSILISGIRHMLYVLCSDTLSYCYRCPVIRSMASTEAIYMFPIMC